MKIRISASGGHQTFKLQSSYSLRIMSYPTICSIRSSQIHSAVSAFADDLETAGSTVDRAPGHIPIQGTFDDSNIRATESLI
jgi:hypothetical protein